MTLRQTFSEILAHWTDTAAAGVIALVDRFVSPRVVRLSEAERPNRFVLQSGGKDVGDTQNVDFVGGRFVGTEIANSIKGSRIELVLQPKRFLVRPLELPSRASEFLDGIVRAQIDRLTPWSADEAAFGCSKPADAGTGRILVIVAATARSMLAPYVRAFAGEGIRSIAISTRSPDAAPGASAINVLQENV